MCVAAHSGNTRIVRYLVEEHGADINRAGDLGFTPLIFAALKGHLTLVRYMVKELGADVNKTADNGGTPLLALGAGEMPGE
jgi:ankyrin repeat protein